VDISLRIEGPGGERLADSLDRFLKREFQVESATQSLPALKSSEGDRNIDRKLAIAAIVLALPGFINDTSELAERLEAKQRVEKLIQQIQSENQENNKVWIEVDGKPFLPSQDNLEKILDEIQNA